MSPPPFLIGHHPRRGLLWASIDTTSHHLEGQVAERRFAAYLAPYRSEEDARAALIAAGAGNIEAEQRRGKRRGR